LTIVDNLRNFIICKDMGSNIDIVPELQRWDKKGNVRKDLQSTPSKNSAPNKQQKMDNSHIIYPS
jgi:hypothetical protein